MVFCAAALVVTLAQLLGALSSYLAIGGASAVASSTSCVGTSCYEVFTCEGLKESTQHLREPFLELFGAVAFVLGVLGAMYGVEWQLRRAGQFMTILGVLYLGMAVFDGVYTGKCGAYATNIVWSTLVAPFGLPPSPLGGGTQEMLRAMDTWPQEKVATMTNNFSVLAWYLAIAVPWSLALLYAGGEARFLSQLVERGPLGLGVNYGLGQWDEVVNHDAIRIYKERLRRSPFIDDAQLPLPFAVDTDEPRGFPTTGDLESHPSSYTSTALNYGAATKGEAAAFMRARA